MKIADNRALREALGLTYIRLKVWCTDRTRWVPCDVFDELPTGNSRFVLLRTPDAVRCGGFSELLRQAEAGEYDGDEPVIVLR